jgi:hypothetical protein
VGKILIPTIRHQILIIRGKLMGSE